MPSLAELAQGFNRGFVTNTLGAPVDLANALMLGIGGNAPVMGSQWIGDKLQGMGLLPPEPTTTGSSLAALAGGMFTPMGIEGAMANAGKLAHNVERIAAGPGKFIYEVYHPSGKAMGYAEVSDLGDGGARIDMLHTHPEFQRQGVATAIRQRVAQDFDIVPGLRTEAGDALARSMGEP
jgi:ribosomal protein S18 acetylase RimI-like enzyme